VSLIDSSKILEFQSRLLLLQPDCQPVWGKLTAGKMCDHLINSLRVGLGEIVVKAIIPDFLGKLVFPFAMLLPFPRGVPTSPEFLPDSGRDFQESKTSLSELIALFHREVLSDPMQKHIHPVFGEMDRIKGAKLIAKHIEHHFRQFRL
jgi:hypothetical protein